MFSIGAFWNVAFFTQYVYTDLEHGKNESYLVVCLLHDEEFTKQWSGFFKYQIKPSF